MTAIAPLDGVTLAAPRAIGDAIGVLVADGQPLFRDAVARVIRQERSLALVAEHEDGRAALAGIRALRPHVALLDVRLPSLSGPRVVAAVVRDRLPTRVVLLDAHVRPDDAYAALGAGARGYLSKAATAEDIRHAVARAARGDVVIGTAAQSGIAAAIRGRARDEATALTPREQQILERLGAGRTAPDIARELHVATATIKTHLVHLYQKLAVSDRAAAVAEGMRRGLLE